MESIELVVSSVKEEAPGIRGVTLTRANGDPLPGWTAGAHVDVQIPGADHRSYSLVNTSDQPDATTAPVTYRLGVRLEESGRGGSAYVHRLNVGDVIHVSHPKNNFPLAPTDEEVVLLAGGIGITPIASMAAELKAQGKRFRLVYAARNRAGLAFVREISELCSSTFSAHCDDEGGMFDLRALMTSLRAQPLYLCGPTALIDTAIALARELGWEDGRLRFELFSAAAPSEGDSAFDVVLSRSGKIVHVRADQTILDAITEAGESPLCDCRCGDCGLCQVGVIDGIPDHRDYYLSDKEKSSNKFIQICVSRSKTSQLILDI